MFGYLDNNSEKVFLGYHEETALRICVEAGRELQIFSETFEYPASIIFLASFKK